MTLRRALLPLGLGLLLALALALLLAVGWLGAPGPDVLDLVRYLLASGLISLGLGLAGLAWLRRGRGRLWVQIALTYTIGVAIAIFNVFLTAQLMFISADHDLLLLVLLLAFAAVVSLTLGVILARALAQRVTALYGSARAVAQGDLAVRVQPEGDDELAELSHEFNRMAAQLAAAADERERLEAARRDLIAAVSHDLRTPLASLRVMTEALSDGLVTDPQTTARYLATMRGQIDHLSGLIDDLFELAQIEAGALAIELQRVAPSDLVSDTIEAMQPQAAARSVSLSGSQATDMAAVLAAPQKIERVLYNLVSNAIRHTPPAGDVTIRVYPGERPAAQASGSAIGGGGTFVVFEVADSGEGIPADDLPFVFDRFFRGEKSRSRATGGAGLGLAIARGIVAAHGGTIWAESEPGLGTRVRFTLPAAPRASDN